MDLPTDWEGLIICGIEAREAGDTSNWELGDCANVVAPTGERQPLGMGTLQDYANEIKVDYVTLRTYKGVSVKFDNVARATFSMLSWSFFRLVQNEDDPEYWLGEAKRHKWTYAQLEAALQPEKTPLSDPAVGTYRAVVIDPPWPMEKIEREVRPRQTKSLDYPTQDIEELKAWPAQNFMAKDGCHIYLWTTQHFLEDAFDVMRAWGVEPQCVLVWHKNVGYTPYSFMYNAEFVVFGCLGGLELLKNGEKVVFEGDVREHSRKPDEFYDLVRRVSPEPRIDVFSCEKREGFNQWGDEPDKF